MLNVHSNKDTSVQYKRMSNLHLLHISAKNLLISLIKHNYLDKRIQYKTKTVIMIFINTVSLLQSVRLMC